MGSLSLFISDVSAPVCSVHVGTLKFLDNLLCARRMSTHAQTSLRYIAWNHLAEGKLPIFGVSLIGSYFSCNLHGHKRGTVWIAATVGQWVSHFLWQK